MLTILEVFALKRLYGRRIRVLHRWMDQTMNDTLTQMGLTAAQGHIMGFLSRQKEPPCSRDVARALELSHPTVSGLLARMERKGFLQLRPDPKDGRARRIHLLSRGEECVAHIEEVIRAGEQRMVQDFTEEERQRFMEYLDRAIVNMGGSSCLTQESKEERNPNA